MMAIFTCSYLKLWPSALIIILLDYGLRVDLINIILDILGG
jgi:hypothetical protein